MKKLLCFMAAVVLALAISVTAFAAGNEKVTLRAEGTAYPGDRITVTVEISGSDPVVGLDIYPDYDGDVFMLHLSDENFLVQPDDQYVTEDAEYVASWHSPAQIDGAVFQFVLEPRGEAKPGTVSTVGCQIRATLADGTMMDYRDVTTVSVTVAACPHTDYERVQEPQYIKNPADCQSLREYYYCCSKCRQPISLSYLSTERGDHSFDAMVESELYLCEAGDCVTGSTYYYSCSDCGMKGTEVFESENGGTHNFDAKVETEDYLSDPGDCQNKRQYYYSCSGCGLKGTETFVSERKFGVHEYDNSCDTECNVCGKYQEPEHVLTEEWDSDDNGHFHTCTQCQEQVDVQTHIPGPEATAEDHQVCTVCGYVLAVSDEHQHEYSAQWSHDDKSHWHECSCQAKSDLAVHSWTVVDTDRTDVLVARCETCGVTKEEPVPSGPDDTQPSETIPTRPPQTVTTEPEKEGGNTAALILGILLALSLVGNAVLTILLITGKKK